MLDAALALFMERGYDDTTIQQVATAAGVAVQTVYFTFGNKARLLAEVEDRVILGNAPAEQWTEQPWAADLRSETDPRKLLDLFVDVDSQIKARLSPFIAKLGALLSNGSLSAPGREQRRDAFFGTVIDRLHQLGALRAGLSDGGRHGRRDDRHDEQIHERGHDRDPAEPGERDRQRGELGGE
jgi:AcrR family transcriptional regulator